MPRNPGQTVPVEPHDAVAHQQQAEEYLRAAQHCLLQGDLNAAAGTAVDAGINAADAVAGMNLGQRWKGPHEQAADFVAKAGDEGKEVARELRRLLPLKTQSHYEPAQVSATKARGAVAAAERVVSIARRVVARAR
ncbi:MAG: HEPN domain-containing protein [Pseudonocardia sp.]